MSAREHVLRLQEELSKYQLLLPSCPNNQLVQTTLQPSVQPSVQPSASINSTSSTHHKGDHVLPTDAQKVEAETDVAKLRREFQDVTLRLQDVTQQLQRYQINHAYPAPTLNKLK